jgi:hypothetical protein
MPATSEKQKKFMDAVAHNPAFAKKVGVPKSVGKDFSEASKGMKFGKDRSVATRADRQKINNPKTNQGKQELFKEGGSMATKMNPGFMAMMAKKKAGAKSEMPSKMGKPVMKKGMDTAKDGMKKMANGGITSAKMGAVPSGGNKGKGEHAVQKSGISKGTMVKMSGSKPLGMKKGGKAYC